jgi:hypothetical protein
MARSNVSLAQIWVFAGKSKPAGSTPRMVRETRPSMDTVCPPRRASAEATLPETVANQDVAAAAGSARGVSLGREALTDDWRDAEHREEVGDTKAPCTGSSSSSKAMSHSRA